MSERILPQLLTSYVSGCRRRRGIRTHRVDLTRSDRPSRVTRGPQRRTTPQFPFVDSDPFSHNYTPSPYVGANSDEEKAPDQSDVEDEDGECDEEDTARVNYARYKEDDLTHRANLFDGVKSTEITYSDPDPTMSLTRKGCLRRIRTTLFRTCTHLTSFGPTTI